MPALWTETIEVVNSLLSEMPYHGLLLNDRYLHHYFSSKIQAKHPKLKSATIIVWLTQSRWRRCWRRAALYGRDGSHNDYGEFAMVMPMQQLPLSYEQLRSLMIETFARHEEPTQLGELNKLVGRLACEKNLVPDPNGPDPSRNAMYFLDKQDVARVQDVFWDFIIEGIIRPGLGKDSGNSELPFFHVTDYGKEQIRHGTGSPHDPDGYLNRLRADVTALDPVIVTCLNECLRTFRIGCLLSSAVMLGCASEKALLLLIDSYCTALPPAKEKPFRKKTEGKFIKTQYEEFIKMLQGHLRAQLPNELNDGLANILLGVFEMIRAERNDAGHPTGKTPSREVAFSNISVFPGYIKRIYDLIAWLQSKSPGGLP